MALGSRGVRWMLGLVGAALVAGCATPPQVPARLETGPGRLTQADVMETILEHKAALGECVELERRERPGSTGKLLMTWTVLTSGKTTNIVVASEEHRGTPIAICVSAVIESMVFPKHEVPGNPITFPFRF